MQIICQGSKLYGNHQPALNCGFTLFIYGLGLVGLYCEFQFTERNIFMHDVILEPLLYTVQRVYLQGPNFCEFCKVLMSLQILILKHLT